ncbi:signal peptidase I [Halorubrum sp. ASP1]|uniref:signal peptidase I n=1 Tax=Halorubrum sp. ASP1 TaxID=2518114 RepID=UPI0010F59B68|nr:signal peptidase I [Halorubrum sp. ASP1]TKX62699.1 signal peptidase I [Halorubrum sp. ASP1]
MLRTALTVAALVALVALALSAVTPLGFGYVYSDSMEPTLGVDDGFVLVPADDVDVGDVVTYEDARTGELVTHRVVGREAGGYLTRGDANSATDQAAGAPVVTDATVRGVLLEVGGRPVVVPGFGRVAGAVSGSLGVLLGGLALLALAATLRPRPRRRVGRSVVRSGEVVWPVVATTFVVTVALVAIAPAGYDASFVVTEAGVGSSLTADAEVVREVGVSVVRSPVATLLVETEGAAVDGLPEGTVTASALAPYTTANDRRAVPVPFVDATIPVLSERAYALPLAIRTPPQPGAITATLRVYPYPATLPEGTLLALHRLHPLLAAVTSAGAGLLPFAVAYRICFDGRVPLRPLATLRAPALRRWSR